MNDSKRRKVNARSRDIDNILLGYSGDIDYGILLCSINQLARPPHHNDLLSFHRLVLLYLSEGVFVFTRIHA
jgi:hypothetical protein